MAAATTPQTDVDIDLDRLARLDVRTLQQLHRALFGTEHPVSNAGHLRRKIAWHVQARKEAGLPDSARQYAVAIARQTALRVRIADNVARRKRGVSLDRTVTTQVAPTQNVRLPIAGTLLVKEFKDKTHVVKVLDNGFECFEYDGGERATA